MAADCRSWGIRGVALTVFAQLLSCGSANPSGAERLQDRVYWQFGVNDPDEVFGGVVSFGVEVYGAFVGALTGESSPRISMDGGGTWTEVDEIPLGVEDGTGTLGIAVLVGSEGLITQVGEAGSAPTDVAWGDWAGLSTKPDLHAAASLGGGRYVAVGEQGAVLFSDPLDAGAPQTEGDWHWYARDAIDPDPGAPPRTGIEGSQAWYDVAALSVGVVVVGEAGSIRVLHDGDEAWTVVSPPAALAARTFRAVSADSEQSFVVVGDDGALIHCDLDATGAWTCLAPSDAPPMLSGHDLLGVDADERLTVIVGEHGLVLTVPNGEDWTAPSLAWNAVSLNMGPYDFRFVDVEATGFEYVTVGADVGELQGGGVVFRGALSVDDECAVSVAMGNDLWAPFGPWPGAVCTPDQSPNGEPPDFGPSDTGEPDPFEPAVVPFQACLVSGADVWGGGPVTVGDPVYGDDATVSIDSGTPGFVYATPQTEFYADQFTATWETSSGTVHQTEINVLNKAYEGVFCGVRSDEPVLCRHAATGQDESELPPFRGLSEAGTLPGIADVFTGDVDGGGVSTYHPIQYAVRVSRFRSRPGEDTRIRLDDDERFSDGFRRSHYTKAHTFEIGDVVGFENYVPIRAPMSGYLRLTQPREDPGEAGYGLQRAMLFADADGVEGGADAGVVFEFDGITAICHAYPELPPMWVERGEVIGSVYARTRFDIAVWVNERTHVKGGESEPLEESRTDLWTLHSYLDLLPDSLYAPYAAWGFAPRGQHNACSPSIDRATRDLHALDAQAQYVDGTSTFEPEEEVVRYCQDYLEGRPRAAFTVSVDGNTVTVDASTSSDASVGGAIGKLKMFWGNGQSTVWYDKTETKSFTYPETTPLIRYLYLKVWDNTSPAPLTDETATSLTVPLAFVPEVIPPSGEQTGDFDEDVRFLLDGDGTHPPSQGGATVEIPDQELAVVYGTVLDIEGDPLPGAVITISDHPEFGYTSSRADGRFDFALPGGPSYVVDVALANYTRAQRRVQTSWNAWTSIGEIGLVPTASSEALVLPVVVDGVTGVRETAAPTLVEGTAVAIDDTCDYDGVCNPNHDLFRQPALYVPAHLTAVTRSEDGTETPIEADAWTVRMTEFTQGPNGRTAMPGELPDGVMYTYAVDVKLDESAGESVHFGSWNPSTESLDPSDPLVFYVDNFYHFPVGETVPMGWYDYDRSVWVPSRNGHIVAFVAPTSAWSGVGVRLWDAGPVLNWDEHATELGTGTYVDTNGTEITDDDEEFSFPPFTEDELQQLASRFADRFIESGEVDVWRVPITHFTPWDCNWSGGPPPDADRPAAGADGSPDDDDDGDDDKEPCAEGSLLLCESQVVGETIPLTGVPFTLNYRSDRAPGRGKNRIVVPLAGQEPLPQSLLRVEVELEVAGVTHTERFGRAEAQSLGSWEFAWNGRDGFNRTVEGPRLATVTTTNVYQAQFYATRSEFEQSFGAVADSSQGLSGIAPDRRESAIRISTTWSTWVEYESEIDMFGLWTLDGHHEYSRRRRQLMLGNGDTVDALFKKLEGASGEDNVLDWVYNSPSMTHFGSIRSMRWAPDESDGPLLVNTIGSRSEVNAEVLPWTYELVDPDLCTTPEKLSHPSLQGSGATKDCVSGLVGYDTDDAVHYVTCPYMWDCPALAETTGSLHMYADSEPINGVPAGEIFLTAPTAMAYSPSGRIYVATFHKILRLDPVVTDDGTEAVSEESLVFEVARVRRPFRAIQSGTTHSNPSCAPEDEPCFDGVRELAAMGDGSLFVVDDRGKLHRLSNGGYVERDLLASVADEFATSSEIADQGTGEVAWRALQVVDVEPEGDSSVLLGLQIFPEGVAPENHESTTQLADWYTTPPSGQESARAPLVLGVAGRFNGSQFELIAGSLDARTVNSTCTSSGTFVGDVDLLPSEVGFDLSYGDYERGSYLAGSSEDFLVSQKPIAVAPTPGGGVLVAPPQPCLRYALDETQPSFGWTSHIVYRVRQDHAARVDTDGSDRIAVPSSDGEQSFVFDSGRHQETRDVRTDTVLLTFTYGDEPSSQCLGGYSGPLLCRITDLNGLSTDLTRDATGRVQSVHGPYGDTSTLTYDSETGYLAQVDDASGEVWSVDYYTSSDDAGLIRSFQQPIGQRSFFCYDDGLVTHDIRLPPGTPDLDCDNLELSQDLWFKSFERSELVGDECVVPAAESPDGRRHVIDGHKVTARSAQSDDAGGPPTNDYVVSMGVDRNGTVFRRTDHRSGAWSVTIDYDDDRSETLTSAGELITTRTGPHPYWGLSAPRVVEQVMAIPTDLATYDPAAAPVLDAMGRQVTTVSSALTWDGMTTWTDTKTALVSTTAGPETRVEVTELRQHADGVQWVVTTTSAAGRESSKTYDARLRVAKQIVPEWPTTTTADVTFEYTTDGRVSHVHQGTGRETTYAYYDSVVPEWAGLLHTVSDGLGTVREVLDYDGQLLATQVDVDASTSTGDKFTFSWGAQGVRDGIVMPDGEVHDYESDAFGRADLIVEPPVDDDADAANLWTDLEFDAMDRLLSGSTWRQWDDNGTLGESLAQLTSFYWNDAFDALVGTQIVTDDNDVLSTAMCLDERGRGTQWLSGPTGCPSEPTAFPGFTYHYAGNLLDRLAERQLIAYGPPPLELDEVDLDFTYDAWTRIRSIEFCADSESSTPVDCFDVPLTYDADGLPKTVGDLSYVRGTGAFTSSITGIDVDSIHTEREANTYGEIARISTTDGAASIVDESLGYDARGQVTSTSLSLPSGEDIDRTYRYDARGRLVAAQEVIGTSVEWTCYGLDGNGNRIRMGLGDPTASDPCASSEVTEVWTAGFDDRDRLTYRQADGVRIDYAYDALGRRSSESYSTGRSVEYEWYPDGVLRRVMRTNDMGAMVSDVHYIVNVAGQVVRREAWDLVTNGPGGNPSVDRYAYGQFLRPIARLDEDGHLIQAYVYGSATHSPDLVLDFDGSGDASGSGLVSAKRVLHDHLGTPVALVDTAGTTPHVVGETAVLGPWGESSAWWSTSAPYRPLSFEALPFGFAGGFRDPATGLVQFGARWYDTEAGVWLSPDPKGQDGGANVYQYAAGNPVMNIDPTGEFPVLVVLGLLWEFADVLSDALDVYDIYNQLMDPCLNQAKLLAIALSILGILLPMGAAKLGKRFDDLDDLFEVIKGGCFIAGTLILTSGGFKAIESMAVGDVVVSRAEDPQALILASERPEDGQSTADEAWVAVAPTDAADAVASTNDANRLGPAYVAVIGLSALFLGAALIVPRRRVVSGTAGLLILLSAAGIDDGCDVPAVERVTNTRVEPMLASTEEVLAFAPDNLTWRPVDAGELEPGAEFLHDGHLWILTPEGREDRGAASVRDFEQADEASEHGSASEPEPEQWVLVLGADGPALHRRLKDVVPGEQIAIGGRVMETRGTGFVSDVRWSGNVLSRVLRTFVRTSDTLLRLTVRHADGTESSLVGTPEHPFWSSSRGEWIPIGDLAPGDALTSEDGDSVVVAQVRPESTSAQVFNLEVEATHNYFVAASDSDPVLVHNACKRESSRSLRKKWERHNGEEWPKDPKTGRNLDVSHKKPLADDGTNEPDNLEPIPHDEHVEEHKRNGDFKRWGARGAAARGGGNGGVD